MKSRWSRQASVPDGCPSWQTIRDIFFVVAGVFAARDTRCHEKRRSVSPCRLGRDLGGRRPYRDGVSLDQ
jgi:hypothetical protein